MKKISFDNKDDVTKEHVLDSVLGRLFNVIAKLVQRKI